MKTSWFDFSLGVLAGLALTLVGWGYYHVYGLLKEPVDTRRINWTAADLPAR